MRKVLSKIPAERLEKVRAARAEMQEPYFVEAEKKLGKETADALRELFSIYNESIYIWLALFPRRRVERW